MARSLLALLGLTLLACFAEAKYSGDGTAYSGESSAGFNL